MTAAFLLIVVAAALMVDPSAAYQIGLGRADCTGPAADVHLMGYAKLGQIATGLHLRQYSRAFIVVDNDNKLVFVSADMGMMGYKLRIDVLNRLKETYGNEYNENNVILSGTHTHGGAGGFLMNIVYDLTILGFVQETFDAYALGIYNSIVRAHDNLQEGKIFLNTGNVEEANINRSPTAYAKNPEAEKNRYEGNTDTELVQLKFVRSSDNKAIGMFNWFAVHPTSMNNNNTLISSDNVGYAELLLEMEQNAGELPGKGDFVAALASANLGDVSPNIQGAKCLNTGLPCDDASSTCAGLSQQCVALGPGGLDMFLSTKIIGERIAAQAKVVFAGQGEEITGPVKSLHQYMHVPSETVEYTYENGTKVQGTGCVPAMGYSFAAGTTDGPGFFDFTQGETSENPFWNAVRDFLTEPEPEDIACHKPKPILLATGRMTLPYEWQPHTVPTQVAQIGPLVIPAIPGELTTMSGRRMRDTLTEVMKTVGGYDPAKVKVIIGGLSNMYTSYITTPEEYNVQRYEGASTIYGPLSLPIYQQQFAKLLTAVLKDDASLPPGTPPPDYEDPLSLVPPVIRDSPGASEFGACRTEPTKRASRGTTVSVSFQSGNPRNNVKQEDTFLTVEQKQANGSWKVIATDANWETKFHWKHEKLFFRLDLSSSKATIEWDIPADQAPGEYRIGHAGHWREALSRVVHEFSGYCPSFQVL